MTISSLQLAIALSQVQRQFTLKAYQLSNLWPYLFEFHLQQISDLVASLAVMFTQVQKLADLTKGETQALHLPDEGQSIHISVRIKTEAAHGPRRLRKQSAPLVKANGIHGECRQLRHFTNLHRACCSDNGMRHTHKDTLWTTVQSQEHSRQRSMRRNLFRGLIYSTCFGNRTAGRMCWDSSRQDEGLRWSRWKSALPKSRWWIRQWITEPEFLDRLAAASLIPGPSSTQVAIFIGQSKRGLAGLLVGGCCFIIPAAVLVTLISAVYAHYGSLPQVAGTLYGIKPAVIAIILQALWSLSRTSIKTKLLAVIGVIAVVRNVVGVAPLVVLAIAGIPPA
jgi:Chromate transporter